uniref:Uncharacterized protein n=1 Tax=Anguilla anguilla TaxID=7936 RepID=A0A0E9WS36_ANGAN
MIQTLTHLQYLNFRCTVQNFGLRTRADHESKAFYSSLRTQRPANVQHSHNIAAMLLQCYYIDKTSQQHY